MASAKQQKPACETSSHSHEEHKFSQKMSAWGGKVFGHKHQEHQLPTKHCNTCQCPAPKADQVQKKEHAISVSVKDTKEKDGHKHFSCMELKKKDKQHATHAATKDHKQSASTEIRHKEKVEQQTKIHTANQREHMNEPAANHWYLNMTDHLKEKIMLKKKAKDDKDKYSSSSSSSDSDSEDDACGKKKKNKKHGHETKPASK